MIPRFINAALGIWLMASAGVLNYGGGARNNYVIIGALATSAAIVAVWETTRPLRWLNFAFGFWLVVAPWLFWFDWSATANGTIVGALMTVFAAVGGRVESRFGGGWSVLWNAKKSESRNF